MNKELISDYIYDNYDVENMTQSELDKLYEE